MRPSLHDQPHSKLRYRTHCTASEHKPLSIAPPPDMACLERPFDDDDDDDRGRIHANHHLELRRFSWQLLEWARCDGRRSAAPARCCDPGTFSIRQFSPRGHRPERPDRLSDCPPGETRSTATSRAALGLLAACAPGSVRCGLRPAPDLSTYSKIAAVQLLAPASSPAAGGEGRRRTARTTVYVPIDVASRALTQHDPARIDAYRPMLRSCGSDTPALPYMLRIAGIPLCAILLFEVRIGEAALPSEPGPGYLARTRPACSGSPDDDDDVRDSASPRSPSGEGSVPARRRTPTEKQAQRSRCARPGRFRQRNATRRALELAMCAAHGHGSYSPACQRRHETLPRVGPHHIATALSRQAGQRGRMTEGAWQARRCDAVRWSTPFHHHRGQPDGSATADKVVNDDVDGISCAALRPAPPRDAGRPPAWHVMPSHGTKATSSSSS
ncbi:uncharacterized protein PSFLO_03130 [Pseudozyma flocculosa]|uniref:Uncharacterized protein n=1 Tax=Pseudozyma flocculosa TaxID=84751 RepID=A0A5C3EZF0_9BASI|nr:uncharacterized protein PSFLO_03130 [Pseudozyma flocculosa]